MSTLSSRGKRTIAIVFTTALIVAACGDDNDGEAVPTTTVADSSGAVGGGTATGDTGSDPAPGSPMVATAQGCENGYTDPDIIEVGREVARCEPGFPAPVPLDEPTKIRVASGFKLEFNSPVAIADYRGEYEKENLEIEIVTLSFSDALPQLANGEVDVAIGGLETALFNAGQVDLGVKVIAGNYFPPDAGNYDVAQTGLWCRTDSFADSSKPDYRDLENVAWGSAVGKGSASVYSSVAEILKRAPDFDISKVDVQRIPSTEILTALNNSAVGCGILLDPLWTQVQDNPDFMLAASQTPGEPLGQMSFGNKLLVDRPEVGQAFLRAYMRTVNTYFADNYHEDDAIMDEIQRFTGATDEAIAATRQLKPLTFDWEIRSGTTTRIQQLFIDLGVITNFSTPVDESAIVDRSVAMEILGVQ